MSYVDTRSSAAFEDENKQRVRAFLKALGRLSRKHGLYLDGQADTINGDLALRVRDTKTNDVLDDEVYFLETHEYVDEE
jgi:hypothetical protein